VLWSSLCSAADAPPARPNLLLTGDGIAQLKQRIAVSPTAREQWEQIKQRVDRELAAKLELPPRGANWYHWYVCPKHGNRLKAGKQLAQWQWEHVCPIDDQVLRGDEADVTTDFDGCQLASIHSGNARMILDAGLLYQVTGERKYLEKARQILLAYANKYADYPLHTIRREPKIGGGKVGAQTLDESVWLIPVTQGADLIWDVLGEADRQTIAEKLLIPAAREVILPHRMSIHNIQCWKNSAVGLVGFLLNDPELIKAAIDDPKQGYRVQVEKGVLGDGPWWEGAWGYHFYTMSALWPLAEAAKNHGIDLYDGPFKKMFGAPIDFAMPNRVLPDFSDSHEVNLRGATSIYELGYARYKDPKYLTLLKDSDRRDNMTLYYGVSPLPAASAQSARSVNFPTSGFAILTRGQGEQATWLCLKYGPHGGGHGHPDKLSFVLYARGQVVAPDGGITSYGTPLHAGWYRTTLAHNTLIVDEQNQAVTEGKCIAFGSEGGVDYVVADAGKIYEGVRFVRAAALVDENLMVFIDQVRADKERGLQIAYHQRGTWRDLPTGKAQAAAGKGPAQHLADVMSHDARAGLTLKLDMRENWPTVVSIAGGEETTVLTGTGIGTSTADRVPVMLLQRRSAATAFAWCVALDGQAATLRRLGVQDETGAAVTSDQAAAVEILAKGMTWRLVSNPDKRPVRVNLPDGSQWRTQAAFAVQRVSP
jgi:hypothetical protein